MKMAESVRYELEGQLATITMDDGKVNALSIATLRAVHAAFDQAERDRAVVVLGGREGYFSAGFDLRVFAAGDPGEALEMLTLGATLSERILSFARPVVVACTGHAVAAGAFPLLSADARIGVDGPFQLGLNEVKIGLTVPWFAIELARHRLTPAHFDRAVVSATMHGPHEAVTCGLLDQVVPAAQLRAASLQTATQLAELDAEAHAATKLRARANTLSALRAAIETELTLESFNSAAT
jgi:enoyl-CoA hydratase